MGNGKFWLWQGWLGALGAKSVGKKKVLKA